jgi:hypothetical protein
MASGELRADLDWQSATVDGGRLSVGYTAAPASAWADRVQAVLDRIDRHAGRWGQIKVNRKRVRVACVEPGTEDDLRLLLEGAVQQANTDLAPDEGGDDGGERRTDADEQMTAVFRSFAPDA